MRNLVITAAIAALSLGASANAAPFSLSASSNAGEAKAESRGLIETFLSSTADAFGLVYTAGEKHEKDLVLRYNKKGKACDADKAAELEVDVEEIEKKALAGPEPMYFGF